CVCVEAVVVEALPMWEILSNGFHSEFDVHEEGVEFPIRNRFAGLNDLLQLLSARCERAPSFGFLCQGYFSSLTTDVPAMFWTTITWVFSVTFTCPGVMATYCPSVIAPELDMISCVTSSRFFGSM